MIRPSGARLVLLLWYLAGASPLTAQEDRGRGIPFVTPLWRTLSDSSRAAWVRPLGSVLVPGTGQFLGRQERGALYLIAEAFLLVRFVNFRNEAGREQDRYRDLAFDIARAPFDPGVRDTTFEYFEQMGSFVESGPFDTDPGPGLSPPTDPTTFNGRIWQLARETFFTDPDDPPPPSSAEYQRALDFYRRRAIGPNFQWSWRNAGLEQDLFRQAIRESDEAFRLASQQLGLLLANHVLSAVDAFVSHRLSRPGRPVEIRTALEPPLAGPGGAGQGPRVTFMARVGF